MEDAAAKGIHELRQSFEECIKRNGLRDDVKLSDELAEMITRPGKRGHVACGRLLPRRCRVGRPP